MAVVLVSFAEPIVSDGVTYTAEAWGAPMDGNLWEGWIAFTPRGGGVRIRSPRETTQPNYVDTEYWATGLTLVYLEGALTRALEAREA